MGEGKSTIKFEWGEKHDSQFYGAPLVALSTEATDVFKDDKWVFTANIGGLPYKGEGGTRVEGAINLIRNWILGRPEREV